ncbi:MAG: protoporphyrinogen/coproporphyrinogen oxidase, partial [Terriglobales bacterium]
MNEDRVSKHFARTIVLGAGPAGIAAAIGAGPDTILLERADEIGGLCRSIELEGAVFDIGGHSFHTPHADVRKLVFDSLEMYEQKRQAWCWSHGQLIPYPFQKHFHSLADQNLVNECADGLHHVSANAAERANFEKYLVSKFGIAIAREFLLPYNRKLWGADLGRISTDWVNERVAAALRETPDVKSSTKRMPLADDSVVAYPVRGGFSEIFKALARRVPKISFRTEITQLDSNRRTICTAGGAVFQWQQLVSTIPLPQLIDSIKDAPAELKALAQRLEFLPLRIVFAVLNHSVNTEMQRVYCADADIDAHKIVINSNSSDYLRSLPRSAISAEISGLSRSSEIDGRAL